MNDGMAIWKLLEDNKSAIKQLTPPDLAQVAASLRRGLIMADDINRMQCEQCGEILEDDDEVFECIKCQQGMCDCCIKFSDCEPMCESCIPN